MTIIIIAGGMMQLYVFKWTYLEKVNDAKFWRDLYLSNAEKTDKAIDTLQAAISMLQSQNQSRHRE